MSSHKAVPFEPGAIPLGGAQIRRKSCQFKMQTHTRARARTHIQTRSVRVWQHSGNSGRLNESPYLFCRNNLSIQLEERSLLAAWPQQNHKIQNLIDKRASSQKTGIYIFQPSHGAERYLSAVINYFQQLLSCKGNPNFISKSASTYMVTPILYWWH